MGKCGLRIEIEDGDEPFQIGDTVRGTVQVEVDAPCRCDKLILTRGWSTHGKGNPIHGGGGTKELFRGQWPEAALFLYPFEFTIPPGPVTYHGHYLNVDHYLGVTAEIPWAIDPKAELDFLVEVGDEPDGYHCTPPGSDLEALRAAQDPTRQRTTERLALWAGIGMLVVGLIWLAPNLRMLLTGYAWFKTVWQAVAAGLLAVAGGAVVVLAQRRSLAERKLGPVSVELLPQRVAPGEDLECYLDFTPRSGGRLNRVTATLQARERVVSGSGTHQTGWEHVVYEQPVELEGARDLVPGDPVELIGKLTVPADAPFSFAVPDNQLAWSVAFHVDVAGWPDWLQSLPLFVLPSAAESTRA